MIEGRTVENDKLPNRKYTPWLRMMFGLHNLLDWRIVEAEDATGRRGPCVLIPMEQNNIKMNDNGPAIPIMILHAIDGKGKYGEVARAVVYSTKAERKELRENDLGYNGGNHGLLPVVGNLYEAHQDDYKIKISYERPDISSKSNRANNV